MGGVRGQNNARSEACILPTLALALALTLTLFRQDEQDLQDGVVRNEARIYCSLTPDP